MPKRKERDLVDWNKTVNGKNYAELFIELGKLDKIDSAIIRGRRDNKTQEEVAEQEHVVVNTVKYRTNKLIKLHIKLQKKYPDLLDMIKVGYYVEYAIVNLITDAKIYSIVIQDELFENFEGIKEEAIRRLENTYGKTIHRIHNYKMNVNGIYEVFNL